MNKQLGYATPADLTDLYPQFYWNFATYPDGNPLSQCDVEAKCYILTALVPSARPLPGCARTEMVISHLGMWMLFAKLVCLSKSLPSMRREQRQHVVSE